LRIYARSSSDDKSADRGAACRYRRLGAKEDSPGRHLKLVLEGEEEAGSPNLQRTLELA